MTLEEKLAALGLKKNEIKVYLAGLKKGECGLGDLVKETDLHKQLIYLAAEELQKKGLMSIYQANNRKRFYVANPDVLIEKAKANLSRAEEAATLLREYAKPKKLADSIRIFKGGKEIQQYYLDQMNRQPLHSSVLILGVNSERYFQIFNKEGQIYQEYEQARIGRKVTLQLILFGKSQQEVILNKGRKFIELKLLKDVVQAPNDIIIWENRVGLLFYTDEPYILDIMGQETVEGFIQYFKVLWRRGEEMVIQ